MKKKGYLLFCRRVEFEANSNESIVEQIEYIDKIIGMFENEDFAASYAMSIIRDEFNSIDATNIKIRQFHVEKDMFKGYTLDENGQLGDTPEFHPYIQIKTKPINGKKKIYEKTMYIVDCDYIIEGS